MSGRRWQNIAGTIEYVDRVDAGANIRQPVSTLTAEDQVGEALFTGLRMNQGVDRDEFAARFGVDPWSLYQKDLVPFVETGFMWTADRRFGLTRRGMLMANEILMTFV